MPRKIKLIGLLVILLTLVACSEEIPSVEWELTIDGDVDRTVTFTFADIAHKQHFELTDIPTFNAGESASWEGTPLRLLFRDAGGVQYNVHWFALVTLADGTSHRFSLADLRGTLIALKDGKGNWLADTDVAPLRLIVLNKPSDQWLPGPVRVTIQAP